MKAIKRRIARVNDTIFVNDGNDIFTVTRADETGAAWGTDDDGEHGPYYPAGTTAAFDDQRAYWNTVYVIVEPSPES